MATPPCCSSFRLLRLGLLVSRRPWLQVAHRRVNVFVMLRVVLIIQEQLYMGRTLNMTNKSFNSFMYVMYFNKEVNTVELQRLQFSLNSFLVGIKAACPLPHHDKYSTSLQLLLLLLSLVPLV